MDVINIPGPLVFWIFFAEMTIFMATTVIISYILVKRNPNPKKIATFECGQTPPEETYYEMKGGIRYFSYAAIFFVLDALTWILFAGSLIFKTLTTIVLPMLVYLVTVVFAITYFLSSMKGKELIR